MRKLRCTPTVRPCKDVTKAEGTALDLEVEARGIGSSAPGQGASTVTCGRLARCSTKCCLGDVREAEMVYARLEQDIIPEFYARNDQDIPLA